MTLAFQILLIYMYVVFCLYCYLFLLLTCYLFSRIHVQQFFCAVSSETKSCSHQYLCCSNMMLSSCCQQELTVELNILFHYSENSYEVVEKNFDGNEDDGFERNNEETTIDGHRVMIGGFSTAEDGDESTSGIEATPSTSASSG